MILLVHFNHLIHYFVYNKYMDSVGKILKKFNPTEDKYISREFQSYGVHLADQLDDYKHKSLYIKLAKTTHRSILEKALSFVVDSNARNKGALFMWKVKELKTLKVRIDSK